MRWSRLNRSSQLTHPLSRAAGSLSCPWLPADGSDKDPAEFWKLWNQMRRKVHLWGSSTPPVFPDCYFESHRCGSQRCALPRSPGIASARCQVESTSGTGLRRGKCIFLKKKRFAIRIRPGYEHFILGRAMSPVGQRAAFFKLAGNKTADKEIKWWQCVTRWKRRDDGTLFQQSPEPAVHLACVSMSAF